MEVSQTTKRTYELQVRTLMEENLGEEVSHSINYPRDIRLRRQEARRDQRQRPAYRLGHHPPHTQRFAAGGAQRDIASWEYWWYTAKFTLFQPTWFKAAPFEVPQHTNRNGEVSR